MTRMVWPTATAALFLPAPGRQPAVLRREVGALRPRRRVGRLDQQRPQPGAALARLAARRLPALSWLPGHIPAQDARWPAVGKRLMSVPISATSASAT